jgi:hypothetical protein
MAALESLQLALASADIVSPVEVRVTGGRITLSGAVTEGEGERIGQILRASKVPLPISLQITTPLSDVRSHVAAMALLPTQLVVDKLGKTFRTGESFHDWTVESLEADSLKLRRGERTEIVSVPGGG